MPRSLVLLAYGQMGPFALQSLVGRFDVAVAVTPPPGSRFRNEAVERTEEIARQHGVRIVADPGLSGLHSLVAETAPEGVVICSYNKVIPSHTIELTHFVNVHHGDLPRYRGRANLNWAIINGRDDIGVTVHRVVPELDAGEIYHVWRIPIGPDDYIGDLYAKVNTSVRDGLADIVEGVLAGDIAGTPQVGEATYCCTRLPEDGRIDWTTPAEKVRSLIRGVSRPFEGAFSYVSLPRATEAKKLSIWRAEHPAVVRRFEGAVPGRVVGILPGRGVEVLTGTGPLLITEVALDGRDVRADEVLKSYEITLR